MCEQLVLAIAKKSADGCTPPPECCIRFDEAEIVVQLDDGLSRQLLPEGVAFADLPARSEESLQARLTLGMRRLGFKKEFDRSGVEKIASQDLLRQLTVIARV
ncbi:hypothetical protein JCM31271_30540 [Halorubrum trueperi]